MPVVPATQEAEVGGLLEPGRSRLQQAVMVPLHSNLGKGARPCFKKRDAGMVGEHAAKWLEPRRRRLQ